MFLVPTSSPGFERQPLPTIGDETHQHQLLQRHPALRPVPHRRGQQRLVHPARPAGRRAPPRGTRQQARGRRPRRQAIVRHLARSVEAAVRWAADAPDGDGPMIADEAFLAGIGHLLTEMEASACTPAAMGQDQGLRHGQAGLRGAHRPDRPGRDPAVRRGRRHRRRRHRIRPPAGPAHRDPRRHGRGVPDHHRPARPGPPAPGLPRPQGVPDRRPPRRRARPSAIGPGRPSTERYWAGPDRQAYLLWPARSSSPPPPDTPSTISRTRPQWPSGPSPRRTHPGDHDRENSSSRRVWR